MFHLESLHGPHLEDPVQALFWLALRRFCKRETVDLGPGPEDFFDFQTGLVPGHKSGYC